MHDALELRISSAEEAFHNRLTKALEEAAAKQAATNDKVSRLHSEFHALVSSKFEEARQAIGAVKCNVTDVAADVARLQHEMPQCARTDEVYPMFRDLEEAFAALKAHSAHEFKDVRQTHAESECALRVLLGKWRGLYG